jgi:hypothetical protein
MVNWPGLLNWSTNFHDGTHPSNFKPMSDEDKEWLEGAMKEHCFNDADRMKEILEELKKMREN